MILEILAEFVKSPLIWLLLGAAITAGAFRW